MAAKKTKSTSKTAAAAAPARAPRKRTQAKKPVPPPKKSGKKSVNGKKARSERTKGMFFSVLAAASMGYLEATGMDKKIPQIEQLGAAGTLAAVGIGYGMYAKNKTAEDVGLGYAAISAYKLGFGFGAPAPAEPEKTASKGDFTDVAAIPAGARLPNGMPVLGVDPRLLSEAAVTLEELAGDDDDELAGDDDEDVSGDDEDEEVSGDDEDEEVSGDDEDEE